MSFITQPIPEKEALLIEYPGFVRNPDAAIETLGGLEAVLATAVGSTPLPLRLRPGDPLSHPLEGNKQPTCGLLLRICRKTGDALCAELLTTSLLVDLQEYLHQQHQPRACMAPRAAKRIHSERRGR